MIESGICCYSCDDGDGSDVVSSVGFDQLHRQLDGGFFSRECSCDDGSGGAWGGDVGEVFGVVW